MADALKEVYTKEYISKLCFEIQKYDEIFDIKGFTEAIFDELWESRELKNRMRHIAQSLHAFLPMDYEKQLEVLKETSKAFSSFDAMFFQDFVELYGLESFEASMEALAVFTQDSSSEFAIRAFLIKYEDETLAVMKQWAQSENEHLRRLACEGCRPRLPWGVALSAFKKEPSKVLEIIELLKHDESKYVQKSVANNLNDISKDNPKIVIQFVKENLHQSASLDWICKHASRTLLKKGDTQILKLFGYDKASHINVTQFNYDSSIQKGQELNFSFTLQSEQALGKVRVEYAMYYLKANGSYSKKVFMVHQNEIKACEKSFIKKQSFKDMTTRKHYMGEHHIAIVVNGEEKIKGSFKLYDTCN